MTTRWSTKDPAEEITAAFDYASFNAGAPSSPEVTIAPRIGTDPAAAAMLQGSPIVVGSRVLQRIAGGVAGVEYEVRCLADVGGDRVLIDALLPVVRRPTAG
jgi:hypothetical protein